MKVKVWSDLHLEFRNNLFDHIHIEHADDKETTLLLAGDIGVGFGAVPFITEMCEQFKYVLMICGNHEFYSNDMIKVINGWREIEEGGPENFHFLHNDWRILDDVRFIGGTMWTSFDNENPINMYAAYQRMHDYSDIRYDGKSLTPEIVLDEHKTFMDFLINKFNEPYNGKTVVMTHHSPGNELRRKGNNRDRVGSAYFANIENIIGSYNKACLWVHGHTHRNWDYMINETRVVCNPYGYWGNDTNRKFDRKLLIEI